MPSITLPTINSPFTPKSTAEEVAKGIDLTGKVALVTGGNAGLGKETARVLAKQGAHVFITVRDDKKGTSTVDELKKATGNNKIEYIIMELDSQKSVRAAAKEFQSRHLPLHILVNNAGLSNPLEKKRTADGFEQHFGVNHLAPFLFTNLLLPQLKAAKGARVVVVGSAAHKFRPSGINWDDINFDKEGAYDGWQTYAQSKIANSFFANEFDRKYKKDGIRALSLHPGVIITDIQRDYTEEQLKGPLFADEKGNPQPWVKTIPEGAATQVFAATSPLLNNIGGVYLEDSSIGQFTGEKMSGVEPFLYDEAEEKKLWEESLKWTGLA